MPLTPVTPARIQIAKDFGLENVDLIAVQCRNIGIPFYVACALMEQESNGRNVYGHDLNGALSGYPHPVNRENFRVFEWLIFTKNMVSNGVGPSQITFKGFFTEMAHEGLRPWDPGDNIFFGLRLLWRHYLSNGEDWVAAGAKYNGSVTYGRELAEKIQQWRVRLKIGK